MRPFHVQCRFTGRAGPRFGRPVADVSGSYAGAVPGSSGTSVRASWSAGQKAVPAAAWLFPGPVLDGPSPFRFSFTRSAPTVLLAGDIDEWTYYGLIRALAQVAMPGERRVRVDPAGVEFCDLAGLRAIISLPNGWPRGPTTVEQVVLAHLPRPLQTVLKILGWDSAPGLVVEERAS